MNVSNISFENDETYSICFCKKFCIRSIKKQKNSFSFPFSKYKERKYKNIFVNDKEVYTKISDSIHNGKFEEENCGISFSLVDLIKLKSANRVANVVINFDGLNIVFGVIKKNSYFIVYPPKEFDFIDEDYKKTVFKYIIDLCKREGL